MVGDLRSVLPITQSQEILMTSKLGSTYLHNKPEYIIENRAVYVKMSIMALTHWGLNQMAVHFVDIFECIL